jgi:serine phosphatase RsbU (regulator of sigma subunit)/anti-sigma regulatory factor (Ser/Thr protein kinase)
VPESRRISVEDADLARLKVDLAMAAAGATPLADLDLTARDLTRVLPLLEQVLQVVTGLLGTTRGAVWVIDPAAEELYPVAWLGLPDEAMDGLRPAYGVGSVGRAVVERRAVLAEVETDPSFASLREEARKRGVVSAFSMPMLTLTGEPMGTLTAYYDTLIEPSKRAVTLVELYARQAAEIVERARMHAEARLLAERERRRAGQLRALATAALALSSADDLEDLLRIVTDSARSIVGAHRGVTTRLRHGADDETYVSLSEVSAAWPEPDLSPEDTEAQQHVVRANVPLRAGGHLAAPLVGRTGANLGLIQLSHKLDEAPFSAEDEAILVQLAQMASSAIEAVEALARERAARRDAELAAAAQAALSQASASFSELLDPDEVGQVLARLVVPRLAELALLHLVDDEGNVVLAATESVDPSLQGAAQAFFSRFQVTLDQPYGAGYVLATGHPQLLPELTDEVLTAVSHSADERAQIKQVVRRSGLVVPLVARGRSLGALSISRDEPYTDREVAYAVDLARRAGLAMDNASRYAFERGLAGALQRSLLPRSTPASALLTTASRYLAGARGTQIGGDWYDVIEISRDRLMIVVGDVMGRGVQAAAVMGQLRAAVRAYAIEGHGPAALLTRLDRVVQALDEVNFTTCVVGVLDPETRNLCLASAGHLSPVLISPDGRAELLELDPGLPLGVGEADFVDQWYDLDAGSTVLLYTDGLVEGRHSPVEEGMRRLQEACSATVRSADELCDRVLHALRQDGDHDDDTALLAVLLDEADADAQAPMLLELSASPVSASAARDALCELLGPDGGEPAELACLLLTELVANAVRYAGGQILVRAGVRAHLLLVEVRDSSERMPVLVANPRHDAEGGRGMLLVDRLADRWGAEPLPVGKRVWFELSLDQAG